MVKLPIIRPGIWLTAVIIFSVMVIVGCSSGFPLWHKYLYWNTLANTKTDKYPLHMAQEGAYVLNIYAIDSTIGRKKLTLYFPESSPKLNNTKKVTDQLYLYFIDSVRFVYSRKKLEKIEIDDIRSRWKIGLYEVYLVKDCTPYMVLHLSNSKVKDRDNFKYGRIFLERSSEKYLRFIRAEYPKISDERPQNELDVDHLEGVDLGFHAAWEYTDTLGAELFFNDQKITKIRYIDDSIRYYFINSEKVDSGYYDRTERRSF